MTKTSDLIIDKSKQGVPIAALIVVCFLYRLKTALDKNQLFEDGKN